MTENNQQHEGVVARSCCYQKDVLHLYRMTSGRSVGESRKLAVNSQVRSRPRHWAVPVTCTTSRPFGKILQ